MKLADGVDSKSANRTFFDTRKAILDENISLKFSRFLVNSACMAGVLTSRPNFNVL